MIKESFLENNIIEKPEQDLERASSWQILFKTEWRKIHIKDIFTISPEIKDDYKIGELKKMQMIIEKDLDDDDFRETLGSLEELLLNIFPDLKDLQQSSPHYDIDPVAHTINSLRELDTSNLSNEDKKSARLILLFHDIGKVDDPQSRIHPYKSALIAKNCLEIMGYKKEKQQRILTHIAYHDALGDITRRDGENILEPNDVLSFFPNKEELELHKSVVLADIASIPGLRQELHNVEIAYRFIRKRMYEIENSIKIKEDQNIPFEKIDGRLFYALKDKILERVNFDDVDIDEDIRYRQSKFSNKQDIDIKEMDLIEKAAVQYSLQNDRKTLFALKMMGREIDEDFVSELEKKYQINLDNLRVAVNMFRLTYKLWDLNLVVNNNNVEPEKVKNDIIEIKEIAQELSKYQVEFTHVTDSYRDIRAVGELFKSDSSSQSHFEGDGVYGGLLGSYKDWTPKKHNYNHYDYEEDFAVKTKILKMNILLADCLPIIVSNNFPKAMGNILCESLQVAIPKKNPAVPRGIMRWRQLEFDDEVENWKIRILEQILKTKVMFGNNEYGEKSIVMDTDEKPIVWGAICRALRIRNFIPLKEIYKIKLEEESVLSHHQEIGGGIELLLPDKDEELMKEYDYWQDKVNEVRKIRGVKSRNLKYYV